MSKYTKEEFELIKETYAANSTPETVKELALKLNRPINSIIQKLAFAGIYQKKKYISKFGGEPITKSELLIEFEDIFSDSELDQIEKLTKPLIKKLIKLIMY